LGYLTAVLQIYQVNDRWQGYSMVMQFKADSQLAAIEGIETLEQQSLVSLHFLIQEGMVQVPNGEACSPPAPPPVFFFLLKN